MIPSNACSLPCAICGNSQGNKLHVASEMLFGTGGEFTYLECGACGCLQLQTQLEDLGKYYPSNYYSFSQQKKSTAKKSAKFKDFKKRLRVQHYFGRHSILSHSLLLLDRLQNNPTIEKRIPFLSYLTYSGVERSDSILDVGCGAGSLLQELASCGYSNLHGVDAFIDGDITYPGNVTIRKCDIFGIEQTKFSFIMFNHSFEHMNNPFEVLRKAHDLLLPGKMLLIRIPIADCYGWKHYGVNWYPLDAPRHLMIHTRKSMEILVEETGFKVEKIEDDSCWTTQEHSECRKRGIKELNLNEREKFKLLAKKIKEEGRGDQVCFFLRRM